VSGWPEWPVARLHELGDPDVRGFLVGDGDWPFRGLLVRKLGELRAYANVCPHARHALDFPPGRFLAPDGEHLRCASHGALFEPLTGACVLGPCAGRALMPLALRVVGDEVRVSAPASLTELVMAFPSVGEQ